jgi:TolB-like protein/DNA-binding winged helix-turn-helix (wHTH) protein/tetratricopeptide (TPR) repeat protein
MRKGFVLTSQPATYRFGEFHLDAESGELCSNGRSVRLQPQPLQVLLELLEHPGRIVTREDFQASVWSANTYVEFDDGLNHAIRRLRGALGDTAQVSHYIETIPRRGYRLMVPVEKPESAAPAVPEFSVRPRTAWFVGLVVVISALVVGLVWRHWRQEQIHTPRISSLAVLPLANLSGNPDEEYFADGMTEALITELGKVRALRVVSRQSMLQFKGTTKPVQQIARELHVDAVLEGSAMRADGKVRITAQVVQANPERHLWSESYERDLRDVVGLQSEVARTIVRQMQIKVTPSELARLATSRPVNPAAYEAFLKGSYHRSRRTPDDIARAIQYFRRATEIDPNSVAAWDALAEAYILSTNYRLLTFDRAFPQADLAARKAFELDDTDSEALDLLAGIRLRREWDWTGAERELKRAQELDPNNPDPHYDYANILLAELRIDECIAEYKRALELVPASLIANANLAELLTYRDIMRGGTYDESIAQSRRTLDLDSNFAVAHANLGNAYLHKGMYEEAAAEFSICTERGVCDYQLGLLYALTGRRAAARQELRRLQEISRKRQTEAYGLWLIAAALDDRDEAFRWLEKSYEQRDFNLLFIRYCTVDPACKQLSSDPRFQAVVRRMNFPP